MSVFAACLMWACDNDVEFKDIQKPITYDDAYYQNLRDFKNSKHSISFMYFAQWGGQNSMATRFIGLPDSLDMLSIWGGGIPPVENKQLWEDLRYVQRVKGTKMLYVAIVRLWAEDDSHPFKQLINKGDSLIAAGQEEEGQKYINQGIDEYALYYVDQVFENDLDGFDADYEPEGDNLSGDNFLRFIKKLGEYMGPNPDQTKEERLRVIQERFGTEHNDVNKKLVVDATSAPDAQLVPYVDYLVLQNYGGGSPYEISSWPAEKVVWCVNWGDNWTTDGTQLFNQARWQPSHGYKGGFGAYYGQRDYTIHQYNPEPYGRFRECIQIQNPAVH